MLDLLRPSAAPIWTRCHAGATLTADIVSISGDAAKRGTMIHALAYAKRFGQEDPKSFVVDGQEVAVDDEAHEMADMYLRVIELISMQCDTWGMEERVSLDWYYSPNPMPIRVEGSADFWGWDNETLTLYIGDLKTGVIPVKPTSPQLMLYALCAIGKLNGLSPKKISLMIVQPRDSVTPIKIEEIALPELMAFGLKVDAAIKAIAAGSIVETPGEDQCKFCLRAGVCKSRADRSLAIASAVIVDGVPAPMGCSDEDLSQILDRAEEVENWIKSVRAEVTRRLERGGDVPNWKLVARKGNRKWRDESEIGKFLFESGLEQEDIFESKLRSPAQAEKILKKLGFDPRSIEPFVTRESMAAPSLVRQSDPREQVKSSPALALLSELSN